MSALVFDIETITSSDPDVRAVLARRANGHHQPASAYADALSQAGLYGSSGELFCIAYAIDSDANVILRERDGDAFTRESERAALHAFLAFLKRIKPRPLVGHNIRQFDIPFLWQRAVVHDLTRLAEQVLPLDAKPWERGALVDTMDLWNRGMRGGGSLDAVTVALGIPSPKEALDVSVNRAIKEGRDEDVAEYCRQDVLATREVYYRLTGARPL